MTTVAASANATLSVNLLLAELMMKCAGVFWLSSSYHLISKGFMRDSSFFREHRPLLGVESVTTVETLLHGIELR